mgnify:CR=1 FL=1
MLLFIYAFSLTAARDSKCNYILNTLTLEAEAAISVRIGVFYYVPICSLSLAIFSTDQWCIGCGDENKDILGKAIIVHQGTDDFTSQPSGAAGARVSCAGIIE